MVGRMPGEVPFTLSYQRLSVLVRAAAYEALGQLALADQALAEAVAMDSLDRAQHTLTVNDSLAPAKQTVARFQELERQRRAQSSAEVKRALVIVGIVVGALLLLGGIGAVIARIYFSAG